MQCLTPRHLHIEFSNISIMTIFAAKASDFRLIREKSCKCFSKIIFIVCIMRLIYLINKITHSIMINRINIIFSSSSFSSCFYYIDTPKSIRHIYKHSSIRHLTCQNLYFCQAILIITITFSHRHCN